jgi:hypothetical protein
MEDLMNKQIIRLFLLLFICLLAGCSWFERGQPVAFESVAQEPLRATDDQPLLLVINNVQELDAIKRTRTQKLGDYTKVNYQRVFTIQVAHQVAPTSGYFLTVRQITRARDRVTIDATLTSPTGNQGMDVVRRPYHIVAIPKDATWRGPIRFTLVVDRTMMAEMTYNFLNSQF